MPLRYRYAALLTLLFSSSLPALSQSTVADIRDQLGRDVRNSDIGAGYAQMLNLFTDPSISASLLELDDGVDYNIFKLPLQIELPPSERGWQWILRGTLSKARAEGELSVFENEIIDTRWDATSGELGAGLLIPVSRGLSVFAAGEVGISRLENEAEYNGPLGDIVLAPVADGVLFNWDTNARILSATLGLNQQWKLRERYDLSLNSHYTFSHIASYSESDDLPSFSEDTGTLAAKIDFRHPYAATVADLPLFGVAHLGATAFTGPNRDALDFSHFYEAGYSLGLDLPETSRYFESLSLGYQWNFGGGVDGYSILFGWALK